MEKLIYNGVEFNVGDTVAYTDAAKAQAIEEEWLEHGYIPEGCIDKEHKILSFTDTVNASGDHNMILDHPNGETAPDHLKLVKKATDEH